jgi:hypothetical protein
MDLFELSCLFVFEDSQITLCHVLLTRELICRSARLSGCISFFLLCFAFFKSALLCIVLFDLFGVGRIVFFESFRFVLMTKDLQ